MSFQFREPCTRSLRPWNFFRRPLTARLFVQGTPLLPKRHYIPPVPQKKVTRLWLHYQNTYATCKSSLDTEHYDVLMTTLLDKAQHGSKTGYWTKIIQAFEESKLINVSTSPNMYVVAIEAYGRCRNKLKVTSIFKEFKKRYLLKSRWYGVYFNALIDCGELTMARRVLVQDIMYDPCVSRKQVSVHLSKFVEYCLKRHNVPLAIQMVESHHGFTWDKDALDRVIHVLFNVPVTPLSIEAFIENYSTQDKVTRIELFTLFNLVCKQDQFVPTLKTCHLVLQQLVRGDHTSRVKSVLCYMQRVGIQPTLETVDILKESSQVTNLDEHVYKNWLMAIEKIQEQNSTKLKGFMDRGELETVGLGWIDKHGVDLDAHALVLEYWVKQGQWNRCIIEFDRLFDQNVNLNRKCIKSMLAAWLASGQDWMYCERVVDQYKSIFRGATAIHLLDTLSRLETKRGQPLVPGEHIVKSLQLMEHKLNIPFTAQEISQVILLLGKRGDIENGYRLYKWARSTEKNNERCAEEGIYRAVMESATRNNDTRRLERAWVDMQYRQRFLGNQDETKQQHNLTLYNILLNGFASRLPRPDLTCVRKLYQRMLKQKMIPDIVTYNILIKAFVNANNMEAANQIFKKMIESGIEPDRYSTNTILNGWIIRRDWNHVETFVKELRESPHKLDLVTFNLLVQSFLQLDSKTMNYTHILKHQNKWKHIEQLQEEKRDGIKMTRDKIWQIFESTTGFSKQSIINLKQPLETNQGAFIKLFSSKDEPDHVTYKLFMKAFDSVGDIKSAETISRWMKYRLNK